MPKVNKKTSFEQGCLKQEHEYMYNFFTLFRCCAVEEDGTVKCVPCVDGHVFFHKMCDLRRCAN